MMFLDKLTEKRKLPNPNEQSLRVAMNLAKEIVAPIYEATKNILAENRNLFRKLLKEYIFFPRSLVSGFSCYFCPRCLAALPPIPVIQRGSDLTCRARHSCQSGESKMDEPISNHDFKLTDRLFVFLFANIQQWIPGKKLIIANKISPPKGSNDESTRKYLETKYDIPNKYYLSIIKDFERSPWVLRLLREGKIVPTMEELIDFCYYCVGTYAILHVDYPGSTTYYSVFLAPADSVPGAAEVQGNGSHMTNRATGKNTVSETTLDGATINKVKNVQVDNKVAIPFSFEN
jgi:hypothetical protein